MGLLSHGGDECMPASDITSVTEIGEIYVREWM